jgi:hypothetical protein
MMLGIKPPGPLGSPAVDDRVVPLIACLIGPFCHSGLQRLLVHCTIRALPTLAFSYHPYLPLFPHGMLLARPEEVL